jgi:hypothetical protein
MFAPIAIALFSLGVACGGGGPQPQKDPPAPPLPQAGETRPAEVCENSWCDYEAGCDGSMTNYDGYCVCTVCRAQNAY